MTDKLIINNTRSIIPRPYRDVGSFKQNLDFYGREPDFVLKLSVKSGILRLPSLIDEIGEEFNYNGKLESDPLNAFTFQYDNWIDSLVSYIDFASWACCVQEADEYLESFDKNVIKNLAYESASFIENLISIMNQFDKNLKKRNFGRKLKNIIGSVLDRIKILRNSISHNQSNICAFCIEYDEFPFICPGFVLAAPVAKGHMGTNEDFHGSKLSATSLNAFIHEVIFDLFYLQDCIYKIINNEFDISEIDMGYDTDSLDICISRLSDLGILGMPYEYQVLQPLCVYENDDVIIGVSRLVFEFGNRGTGYNVVARPTVFGRYVKNFVFDAVYTGIDWRENGGDKYLNHFGEGLGAE
ncbi:hypothetical protein [Rubricoccus marinus]|uniref:hypothetical protein n=1 Tax=Rubricoccus marinus TaxID=716817 RepID=UPI001179A365|nr:hypothetical protein [Rubricoccus marinus]